MTDHIIVFARITPKPQFYEKVEDTLLKVIPMALDGPGCLALNLYKGKEDDSFYVYEVWENEKAHAYHAAQEYTKEALKNFKMWLSKPIEVIDLSKMI